MKHSVLNKKYVLYHFKIQCISVCLNSLIHIRNLLLVIEEMGRGWIIFGWNGLIFLIADFLECRFFKNKNDIKSKIYFVVVKKCFIDEIFWKSFQVYLYNNFHQQEKHNLSDKLNQTKINYLFTTSCLRHLSKWFDPQTAHISDLYTLEEIAPTINSYCRSESNNA